MPKEPRRLFYERFPQQCVGVDGVHKPCYGVQLAVERLLADLRMGKTTMVDALESANKQGKELLGCQGLVTNLEPGCFAPDDQCGLLEPRTEYGAPF